MQLQVIHSLEQISAAQWNQLDRNECPFLRHEFLVALERHHCVGPQLGWLPRHVALRHNEKIIAAAPCYIKHNSYGELVFDWAWADAYARAGRHYYPKLVSAVPYTPAPGPRLLLHSDAPSDAREKLIQGLQILVEQQQLSTAHVLFTQKKDNQALSDAGWLARLGCQYHWHNQNYRSFDDFLASLSSRKRKQIRKERNQAHSHGLVLEKVSGSEANEQQWQAMAHFYETTFDKKGGLATLNLDFFQDISQSMGENILLILAKMNEQYVAGALLYHNNHTLYGRHWGCDEELPGLHFELCYYQGIEFAIEQGLKKFEPGAQGEHKISRGFLPTATWSYHWIADSDFRQAIAQYLEQEQRLMHDYMNELNQRSPYRQEDSQ